MQSVSAVFTAVEKAPFRQIVENVLVSWHKQSTIGNRTFTIGVSTIGGNDIIGINPGAIGSPSNYKYFDETPRVMSMNWERAYNMPQGGLTMALADAQFDNTSRRFTPRYMGGSSELFTAIQPGKPAIISAGFNVGGTEQTLPQFAGIISEQPQVTMRDRKMSLKMQDYIHYFRSKKLDTAVIFTGQRTDQVLTTLATQLGLSTAQYDFDMGINIIPFGAFDTGVSFADAIGKLVEAENGHFYQDESGIFKFENRQHWDSAPYTTVQKVITTAMVIDSMAPSQDHLINVVEVRGTPRNKEQNQLMYQATGFAGIDPTTIPASGNVDVWVSFDDPMLAIDTPAPNGTTNQTSFFVVNSASDGSGTDMTSSVYVKSIAKFANSCKIVFANNSTSAGYLTSLDIWGRPARRSGDVYYRSERSASVTAYQEQPFLVDNEFIQSQDWARAYGEMIIKDYAFPENLQKIIIRAIPELQLGDLISWQGKLWRIFELRVTLDPQVGFTQELTLLQRTINSYFRIGISTIGGSAQIAP